MTKKTLLLHLQNSQPGSISPHPERTCTLPGSISPLPEWTCTLPGSISPLPERTCTLPGSISPLPEWTCTLPGSISPLPEWTCTLPGSISPLPEWTCTPTFLFISLLPTITITNGRDTRFPIWLGNIPSPYLAIARRRNYLFRWSYVRKQPRGLQGTSFNQRWYCMVSNTCWSIKCWFSFLLVKCFLIFCQPSDQPAMDWSSASSRKSRSFRFIPIRQPSKKPYIALILYFLWPTTICLLFSWHALLRRNWQKMPATPCFNRRRTCFSGSYSILTIFVNSFSLMGPGGNGKTCI